MRVAIVGSSGYIARRVIEGMKGSEDIEQILCIDRHAGADARLELEDSESFDYGLLDPIDLVVFTAAVSSPDKCADEFEASWDVNVVGTSDFIRRAISRECRVLFLSSDSVYGRDEGRPFDEGSATRPYTPYGRMKKAVEDEFSGDERFKAIRLSYVASATDRFVSYCLGCIRRGAVAEVYHPFYRNATVASDVVHVIRSLATGWDRFGYTFLNVVGDELISRVRMADEINRWTDGALRYVVSVPGEDFFRNRPQITQVRSLYLQELLPQASFSEKFSIELGDVEL